MKLLRRVPLVLIALVLWFVVKLVGPELTIANPLSAVFIIGLFIVSNIEFIKSSDITVSTFTLDLLFAFIGTVVCVSMAWYEYGVLGNMPCLADLVVFGVVVADATISPMNSFRTALRNVQAGVNAAPSEEE